MTAHAQNEPKNKTTQSKHSKTVPTWWTVKTQRITLRSHFGSSHFLFERARCFSSTRALLVLPCPSVYNPVLLFPTCSHGTCEWWNRMCQFLRYLPLLRIWVLLTALFLTSKEQDTVPVRWRRKSTKCSYKLRSCRYSYRADPGSKIASKRFPRQWPRMMRRSRILNKMVSSLCSPCYHIGNECNVRLQWIRLGKILEYTRT